jgi:hypothetical protein
MRIREKLHVVTFFKFSPVRIEICLIACSSGRGEDAAGVASKADREEM